MLTRIAALAAAVLLACAPASAQLDTRTLPQAAPLTGSEKMPAVQGAGCPSKTTPCASVAVTPSLISTYLGATLQPRDSDLDAIAALPTVDYGRQLLVQGDAATARSTLGLGSIATQAASAVAITGGTVAGITDLAIADGGTGASTASAARGNLGAAASGANADITALSGLTTALSLTQGGTGAASATAARSALGLSTMATQSSASVSISGGSITGLSALTTAATISPTADNLRALGSTSLRWSAAYAVQLRPGSGAPIWTSGAGTPLGVLSAPVGSLYTRTDGGTATTLYVKESGTDATGWVAK